MKWIPEHERRRAVEQLLSGVQSQKSQPAPEPQVQTLSDNAVRVLIKAALEVGLFLLAIYEALGLHPAQGKSAVNELEGRGMVRKHRVTLGGRSGQAHVLEVLKPGKAELEKRGIQVAEKKLRRGGFRHDLWARYIEKWARAKGYTCWFERTLGNKAFDFVYEDALRDLRAIEICMSGSVEWNASQTIKGAEVQGAKEVVLACERREFLKAILSEVKKFDALGLYKDKIRGVVLSEFLE